MMPTGGKNKGGCLVRQKRIGLLHLSLMCEPKSRFTDGRTLIDEVLRSTYAGSVSTLDNGLLVQKFADYVPSGADQPKQPECCGRNAH
jgi:hypothetical protein